ncbi:hypothetical protein VSU01S_12870 [Vibrio superstes NBRC 103154]|uniref:Uncharacterized protein n=1 Tax=Vibrio superstes NBRC 103154 TaxID=1219062 RepID=A0A511QR29_9VIBR|nr:hypothetical protein VSU01S_12870 [Vibrio superstes NBRC 103154]
MLLSLKAAEVTANQGIKNIKITLILLIIFLRIIEISAVVVLAVIARICCLYDDWLAYELISLYLILFWIFFAYLIARVIVSCNSSD